ncbi:hypothetical protein LXL04_028007 [Taraxacum kok-saghyz]
MPYPIGPMEYIRNRSQNPKRSPVSGFPTDGSNENRLEEHQFTDLQQELASVALTSGSDAWVWKADPGSGFSVKSARAMIDASILDVDDMATRWNRMVPAKMNVFAWRLMMNRLPTKVNLDRRGIDCGSIRCGVCDDDLETVNHLFFSCEMAVDLWTKVVKWWDIDIPLCSTMREWATWMHGVRIRDGAKRCLEAVCLTTMWVIWMYRNKFLFDPVKPRLVCSN